MGSTVTDWVAVTRRNARSVQTTIGWIFWDPGAGARPAAVEAAFGSISPLGIRAVFDLLPEPGMFEQLRSARDAAVLEGLARHAPDILVPLTEFGPLLWDVVDRLPRVGRVLFGAHLALPRSGDPVLSGWHAVNCLREWRGDTHWALVVASGLTHPEASILHNAWLGYEGDWLAHSRGTAPPDIEAGWAALAAKGLAVDRTVTAGGIALRQRIEDDTDRLTTVPWNLLGESRAVAFADRFEPPCVQLLARVDTTAGPNYQPASRLR